MEMITTLMNNSVTFVLPKFCGFSITIITSTISATVCVTILILNNTD